MHVQCTSMLVCLGMAASLLILLVGNEVMSFFIAQC